MQKALFLKPNPDRKVEGNPLRVFDPERKGWLPAEGAAVPNNTYWTRRVSDGDCVDATIKTAPAVQAAPAAPKETSSEAPAPAAVTTSKKKGK